MEKVVTGIKNWFSKVSKNEYVRVFSIVFVLGFIFFGFKALGNGFTMGFNGDYTLQTLAFYSDGYNKIWNFLRTGEFPMFDYSNFLGMNYFGTASFYYLTSPFYYLLLLCPKEYIFQGVYFLLLIKYAFGGLFFYILLKKFFNFKDQTCLIGAIIYAFSGWNLYYLWFHFADAMAVFPLFIMGLEYCLQKKKGWLITVSLFTVALCNYFFFVTFAIFGVFYFIFRWIKIYGLTKRNGYKFTERWYVAIKGASYYIVGGLLAGFVLIPNLIVVQQSGRVDEGLMETFLAFFKNEEVVDGVTILSGMKPFKEIFSKENLEGLFKFMFVWEDRGTNGMIIKGQQTMLYIVSNFLFMNTNCWDTTVFNNSGLDNNLGGLFITTPLILLFVPAFINTLKSKKPFDIFTVIFCMIIPFIPFTFYLLHGFTYEYGRWQICLVLIALIYCLRTYDNLENVNRWMLSLGIIVNVALAGYCVYYSYNNGTLDMELKIIAIIGQFIFMFICYHLTFVYYKKEWFNKLFTGFVIVELFISTFVTVEAHGVTNYNYLYGGAKTYTEEQVMIDDLKESDDSFYRIFNNKATRNYTNLPSALSYNGLSTFNSIYNQNNNKFIDRSDVWYAGGWSMGYHEKRPYFDEFTGVKYYIVDKNYLNTDDSYNGSMYEGASPFIAKQTYDVNVPFGYTKLDTNYTNFDIYENTNHIELGFAYDTYTYLDHAYYESSYYETLYSKMAIIDKENEDLYLNNYEEVVTNKLTNFNKEANWYNPYSLIYNSSLIKTVSMRNDFSNDPSTRETFIVSSHSDLVNKIRNNYGQYGTMMHGRWVENGYFGDEITLTSSVSIAKDATKENPANIILNMQMGPQCLVSLYGANDKLLTQDCHMYHNYSISTKWYERKMERSYYVSEEVKKIVIEFIHDANIDTNMSNSMFNLDDISVRYRYYNDYLNDWSFALNNKLENIENTANSFSFETNYDAQKIVCLNVPYDQGWTLTVDDEETDIIMMNGGFIGFIAKSGNHKYFLNYVTPGMDTGVLISIGGIGLGAVVGFIFNFKYCINVTKGVITNSILYKKKDEEDEEVPNKTINVLTGLISLIGALLISNLFSSLSNGFIHLLGFILGYIVLTGISYLISILFKRSSFKKDDLIKYSKKYLVGLVIALVLYGLFSILRIYVTYKYLVSYLLMMPILYLVNKKVLNNKF